GGGGLGTDFDCDGGLIPRLARCVTTGEGSRQDWETCTIIPATAHTLRGECFDASEDGAGRGTPFVPMHCREVAGTVTSNYGKQPDSSDSALGPNIVAFAQHQGDEVRTMEVAGALAAEPGAKQQTYLAYSTKLHNTTSNGAGKLYPEYTASL